MKKFLWFFLTLSLLFSGCSMIDELMALSVYTDFKNDFQKQWPKLSEGIEVIKDTTENAYVYKLDLKKGQIKGKIGYTYSGEVIVAFDSRFKTPKDKEKTSFHVVRAEIDVVSKDQAKPHLGTDKLKFQLAAMGPTGLILDGDVSTSLTSADFGTTSQVANLEGLYFPLKRPKTAPMTNPNG